MKYVVGAVIGIFIYHYWPDKVRDVAEQTGVIVHEGAKKAVEITRP
jgi:hypothetical protein